MAARDGVAPSEAAIFCSIRYSMSWLSTKSADLRS